MSRVKMLALIALVTLPVSLRAEVKAKVDVEDGYAVHRNLVYSRPGGEELLLDAYVPNATGRLPAILVVHGGAWKSGNKFQLSGYARALAQRGFAAFAINYRLAPKHKHPAQIEDCRAAVQWIRAHAKDYGVDPNRLGAVGYSAGAHLVSLLGTERERTSETQVRAVVAGGTPIDFRVMDPDAKKLVGWLGGTRREIPKVYEEVSPYLHVSPDDPPMFFFHGDADELVDIRGAEEMVKALRKVGIPADLHVIKGGNHILAAMNPEALEASWRFFERNLKDAAPASPARASVATETSPASSAAGSR